MSRGIGECYNKAMEEKAAEVNGQLPGRDSIALAIACFARDNNLKIHPGQEVQKWAELVIKKGGCPCVPGRYQCPCEFALGDIEELGRCRCGLFCNDDYIKEYNRLATPEKGKKKWSRKPGRNSSRKLPSTASQ